MSARHIIRDAACAYRVPIGMLLTEVGGIIILLCVGLWPVAILCCALVIPTVVLFFDFDPPFCLPRYTHMFDLQDTQRVLDYLAEEAPVAFIDKRSGRFIVARNTVPLHFIFEDEYVKARLYL